MYISDNLPDKLLLFEQIRIIIFVCSHSGSLHTFCEGQSADAAAGQLVLMDCRLPHRYYVTEPTELLWFHFFGGESAASTVQAIFPAYSAAVKK